MKLFKEIEVIKKVIVGNNLREFREAKGIRIIQLARLTVISHATISLIELGHSTRKDTAKKIEKSLLVY